MRNVTSGIKVIEDIQGDGLAAAKGDLVEFESKGSLNRGEQIRDRQVTKTRLGKRDLIAGIEHALIGMKSGGYRKVRISPHLAYRNEGVPGKIPPDAVLVYELWLRTVEKG